MGDKPGLLLIYHDVLVALQGLYSIDAGNIFYVS